MNIKIKLDNPQYCDDSCPFLGDEYKHILQYQETFCKYFGMKLTKLKGYHQRIKRLKKCIKENGN